MYTTCVLSTCGSPKRASDPLELELRMAVNCHVRVGNQTQVLGKTGILFVFCCCGKTLTEINLRKERACLT